MREGKYVEEVYKAICKVPDDDPNALTHLMWIANRVAHEHPVWYERFRIRGWFVRGWRWVTSVKWFGLSKRRGDSSAHRDGAA